MHRKEVSAVRELDCSHILINYAVTFKVSLLNYGPSCVSGCIKVARSTVFSESPMAIIKCES
jgi:hypothetical protein